MGTLKDPEILMNTGLIVELSGCNSTATAVHSSEGYSTTVVSQPFLAPRSTVETSMEGGSAIVLATSDTPLSDLLAVAEALLEPGVLDYVHVRRELGLQE
jgi:hypothetical protein